MGAPVPTSVTTEISSFTIIHVQCGWEFCALIGSENDR
jgi:hypothetical protein